MTYRSSSLSFTFHSYTSYALRFSPKWDGGFNLTFGLGGKKNESFLVVKPSSRIVAPSGVMCCVHTNDKFSIRNNIFLCAVYTSSANETEGHHFFST